MGKSRRKIMAEKAAQKSERTIRIVFFSLLVVTLALAVGFSFIR